MTTDRIAIWAEAPGAGTNWVMGDTSRPSGLPWSRQQDDLRHFAETTADRTLIMGRNTFDLLPAVMKTRQATLDRPMIVLTSDPFGLHRETPGTFIQGYSHVTNSDQAASILNLTDTISDHPKIAVIGGPAVIELFAPHLDAMVVSYIRGNYPAADVPAPQLESLDGFFSTSTQLLNGGTRVTTFERHTS